MRSLLFLSLLAVLLTQTACLTPVGGAYDTARLVPEKRVKVQAHYTKLPGPLDRSEQANLGLNVHTGIGKRVNLTLRLERASVNWEAGYTPAPPAPRADPHYGAGWGGALIGLFDAIAPDGDDPNYGRNPRDYGYTYLEGGLKFGVPSNKVALHVPLGLYQRQGGGNLLVLQPRLLLTHTFAGNKVDLTGSASAGFVAGAQGGALFGATIGVGFSTDLDRWAIRPEVGVNAAGPHFGIGMEYYFGR